MKSLSRKLRTLLPMRNPNRIPIIYIQCADEIRALFEYDKRKEVALSANLKIYDYRYMSIFELECDGWEIISNSDAEYKMYGYIKYGELPF